MSRESPQVYKDALMSLKKNQIVSMFKDLKEVLQLNTTGKTKPQLVEDILAIHGSSSRPNLFNGKQLLSFAKDSHIKIPEREAKIDRKAERVQKVSAKKALLDKQIAQGEKKIEELTAQQKARGLKILNLEKQKKTGASIGRERARRYSSYQAAIADFKKRMKGASSAKIAELRKEFAEVTRSFKASMK